jgi:hypothetical protein
MEDKMSREKSNSSLGPTYYTLNIPPVVKAGTPVVVLLHGAGGNENHMASPGSAPGINYDHTTPVTTRDGGGQFAPPPIPPGAFNSIDLDPTILVRSWETALNNAGFCTVNYSQFGQGHERIQTTNLEQLNALLRDLMNDLRHIGRNFVIVAHSRGGILARAAMVDASLNNSFNLGRIERIITLHSPHQGSGLANAAIAISAFFTVVDALVQSNSTAKSTMNVINQWIQDVVGSPGYQDIAVGSPFLTQLAAHEPVPGIKYSTFGGTCSHLLRLRFWVYTPPSYFPAFPPAFPPFHWYSDPIVQEVISDQINPILQPYLAALLGIPMPPGLPLPQAVFPLPPEMMDGIGDVLVTDAAARLPFAVHQSRYLNHAEALWDRNLQDQVMWILDPTYGPSLPPPPPPILTPCEIIRNRVNACDAAIENLQTELGQAAPPQKSALAAQIMKNQAKRAALIKQAKSLNCSPPVN